MSEPMLELPRSPEGRLEVENISELLGIEEDGAATKEDKFLAFLDNARRTRDESFVDAILKTWAVLDGKEKKPVTRLEEGSLRDLYRSWSEYNPEDENSSQAKLGREVRERVTEAADNLSRRTGDSNLTWRVISGERDAPTTALEAEPLESNEVKRENREVGLWFEEALLDVSEKKNDPAWLAQIQKEARALQQKYNLPTEFDPRADTRPATALNKFIEWTEKQRREGGATDQQWANHLVAAEVRDMEAMLRRREFNDLLARNQEEINARFEESQKTNETRYHERVLQGRREADEALKRSAERFEELKRTDPEAAKGKKPPPSKERIEQARARLEPLGLYDGRTPEEAAKLIFDTAVGSQSLDSDVFSLTASRETEGRWIEGSVGYREMKEELTKPDVSWDAYGWSESKREEIRDKLTVILHIEDPMERERVMAALLLHGETADDVSTMIDTFSHPQQGGFRYLIDYLDNLNIMQTDIETLEALVRDKKLRTDALEQQYSKMPDYVEDLAWQIAYNFKDSRFLDNGSMAVIEGKVKEIEILDSRGLKTGRKRFEYKDMVNTDNIFLWERARAIAEDGKHTTSPIDFEQTINLEKGAYGVTLDLYGFLNRVPMFRSRHGDDGVDGQFMVGEFERLAIIFGVPRTSRIVFKQAMGDRKAIQEQRQKDYIDDHFTRKLGWQSLFETLAQMSEKGQAREDGDGKIGAVKTTIKRAYSNVLDPYGMAKALGFISKDEEIILKAVLKEKDSTQSEVQARGLLREFAQLFHVDNLKKRAEKLANSKEGGTVDFGLFLSLNHEGSDIVNGVALIDLYNPDGSLRLGERDVFKIDPKTKEIAKDKKTGQPIVISRHDQLVNFSKFINIFGTGRPNESFEKIFRSMIAARAAEMHGLRTTIDGEDFGSNRDYAERIAYDMMYYLGMASFLNIENPGGFSAEAQLTGEYRIGQTKDKAGTYGNIQSLGLFTRWLLPADHVLTSTVVDSKGNRLSIMQIDDMLQDHRRAMDAEIMQHAKSWMESDKAKKKVQERVEKITSSKGFKNQMRAIDSAVSGAKLTAVEAEQAKRSLKADLFKKIEREVMLDKWDDILQGKKEEGEVGRKAKEALKGYRRITEMHVYEKNAMYDYNQNHYKRGFEMDERIRLGKELRFDEYISEDSTLGSVFKVEKYFSDFATMATSVRKFFENSTIVHSMEIMAWDFKKKEMRLMKVGEALVSGQILRVPDKRFFIGDTGELNWAFINGAEGKRLLTKSFMAGYVAAQLLQYTKIADWNLSSRYSFAMRETILEALSKIPGGVDVDPNDMTKTRIVGAYFDGMFMKKIRRDSDLTVVKSNVLNLLDTFFLGTPGKDNGFLSGILEMLGIAGKGIFA